jgi:CDP-diglyceride synthetase
VVKKTAIGGLIVVVAAVIGGLAVWGIARAAGVELELKERASTDSVAAMDVVFAALVAGLAAWGVYALLKRSGRARWWPAVGSTVLAISMIGPSWYADGASAMALMVMHLVVAVVLIAGFPLVSAERRSSERGWLQGLPHRG